MCQNCRNRMCAYYGDDCVWIRAQAMSEADPNLAVLAHTSFADDNLDLPSLYWNIHRLENHLERRKSLADDITLLDYSAEEIKAAIMSLRELISTAETLLGVTAARNRSEVDCHD